MRPQFYLLFGLLFIGSMSGSAQNLIANGSFESNQGCPSAIGNFFLINNWQAAAGTPDYCHACGSPGVPANNWGYQPAAEGDGYAHLITYYPTQGVNYREFIQVDLACPLEPGVVYNVSYKVSRSELSDFSVDGFGVLFSSTLLQLSPGPGFTPPTPNFSAPGTAIADTANWVRISGTYVASGSENFLVIGNFKNDSQLDIQPAPPVTFPAGANQFASYFVDDVMVEPLDPAGGLTLSGSSVLCTGEVVDLTADLNGATQYQWDHGPVTAAITIDQPGTYAVTAIKNGCSYSDSIEIVADSAPQLPLLNDTAICEGESLTINLAQPGSVDLLWQDGSSAQQRQVDQTGFYSVSATNACGSDLQEFELSYGNCPCALWMPSAFTPNNNGFNDEIGPTFSCPVQNVDFVIANRWGEVVFQSNGEPWSGRKAGEVLPFGVYAWQIVYNEIPTGETHQRSGAITLVR